MKLSMTILLVTLVLLATGLSASNISLEKKYGEVDKSDPSGDMIKHLCLLNMDFKSETLFQTLYKKATLEINK